MIVRRVINKTPFRLMSSMSTKDNTTQAELATAKKLPKNHEVGHKTNDMSNVAFHDKFYNPLLTPPPRSPKSPEDFMQPGRLGHWQSLGFDWTSPLADRYYYHEIIAATVLGFAYTIWLYSYSPDFKHREWAKREAFLRTTKREALGLPLLDKDLIDPDRMILPSEEELALCDFKITM